MTNIGPGQNQVNRCADEWTTLDTDETYQETRGSVSEKVAGIYIFDAAVSEDPHNQVVTTSNFHVCIRPSMSKFQLILAESYWYISFFNTTINLAATAEQSRFQVTFHHSLLENATDTFIKSFAACSFILESFSHSRTKFRGSNLDCHSFTHWQGPGYFVLEVEENMMQCGQWETSCIGETKTEDGSILGPNRVPCKVRGCRAVILQLPDYPCELLEAFVQGSHYCRTVWGRPSLERLETYNVSPVDFEAANSYYFSILATNQYNCVHQQTRIAMRRRCLYFLHGHSPKIGCSFCRSLGVVL